MATGRPAGRPSKPVEVKRALGNPGQRPLPDAPAPGEGLAGVNGIPTPPALGEHGLALWDHVWQAGRTWLSPDSDRTIVTLLCEAQDDYALTRDLLNSGEIPRYYVTANGQMVTHPMVVQLQNLRAQITSWLAAIGFSPADRSRLGLGEVKIQDALDELQNRRVQRTGTA